MVPTQAEKDQLLHSGRLNERELEALEMLQDRMQPPLILKRPRLNGRYTLDTDGVCDNQTECDLLQEHSGEPAKHVG